MANKIKGTFGVIEIIDEYLVQKKTLSKKNNSRIDSEIIFSNKISELLEELNNKLVDSTGTLLGPDGEIIPLDSSSLSEPYPNLKYVVC